MSRTSTRLGLLACGVIALGPEGAWGASFKYADLVPPGATSAVIAGIYGDVAVVEAIGPNGLAGAWTWSGGKFTELPDAGYVLRVSDSGLAVGQPSNAAYSIYDLAAGTAQTYQLPFSDPTNVEVTGINASGTVSATATTGSGRNTTVTAILQDTNGNDTILDQGRRGPTSTGVSDSGTATLTGVRGKDFYSLIYQNGMLTPVKVPKAASVAATINGAGIVFGFGHKGNNGNFGFTYDGTTVTTYDVPGSLNTDIYGVSPAGVAVGTFDDAGEVEHGFIYVKHKYITIDHPNSSSTDLRGMSATGSIIGYYTPTGSQISGVAFIGVCSSPKGCTK